MPRVVLRAAPLFWLGLCLVALAAGSSEVSEEDYAKRAGFQGMRGKKSDDLILRHKQDDLGDSFEEAADEDEDSGLVDDDETVMALSKKASGFVGMRGKKWSGKRSNAFQGMRGKRPSAYPYWERPSRAVASNVADAIAYKMRRGDENRANGFVGMRG
jgi:hypothetical protein